MAWKTLSAAVLTPTLIVATIAHMPAHAQSKSPGRERQLARQLAESESKVRALQERLERLENRVEEIAPPPALRRVAPAGTATSPWAPAGEAAPSSSRTNAQVAPAATPSPPHQRTAARPGSFEVDEDAAQRALERTLTQAGALLVPPGAISITPSLSYQRTEQDSFVPTQLSDPDSGSSGLVLSRNTLRRNEFQARVDFRTGLPWSSQLEVGLPYSYVRSSRIDSFADTDSANGKGIGDVTIGLAKTLMRERGALPDLIGRVTVNTGSGRRTSNDVDLSAGYRQLNLELVGLKRQDPLAFFAGASYGHVFERSERKPGNVTNLSLGTVLAASPATSLQFGFTQTYRREAKIDGVKQPGSDETYGMVNIGASSVLSKGIMLIVSTGIGMGGDAPKYSFNVALPITFY